MRCGNLDDTALCSPMPGASLACARRQPIVCCNVGLSVSALAFEIAASEVLEVLPWRPELSLLPAPETERAREKSKSSTKAHPDVSQVLETAS